MNVLTFDHYFSQENIICAMSCKSFGMMKFGLGESDSMVIKNRKKFLSNLGLSYKDLLSCEVTFGNKIKKVSQKDKGKFRNNIIQGTDGIFSRDKHLVLGVTVADCVPLFFTSRKGNLFGILHLGWKNMMSGTIEELFTQMGKNRDALDKSDPSFLIGPSIKKCHLEIKDSALRFFKKNFPESLELHGSKYFLDLGLAIKNKLIGLGIPEKNIKEVRNCTFCNNELSSWRREGRGFKPMLAIIARA